MNDKKKTDWQLEKATIEYAIQILNRVDSKSGNFKYEAKYAILPHDNTFRGLKYSKLYSIIFLIKHQIKYLTLVCNGLLREGIVAVIDIDDKVSESSVQMRELFESIKMPYLTTHSERLQNTRHGFLGYQYTLNLHPSFLKLSKAFKDLVDYSEWSHFNLIYEDKKGYSSDFCFEPK